MVEDLDHRFGTRETQGLEPALDGRVQVLAFEYVTL
jgi:hypothetical protein